MNWLGLCDLWYGWYLRGWRVRRSTCLYIGDVWGYMDNYYVSWVCGIWFDFVRYIGGYEV